MVVKSLKSKFLSAFLIVQAIIVPVSLGMVVPTQAMETSATVTNVSNEIVNLGNSLANTATKVVNDGFVKGIVFSLWDTGALACSLANDNIGTFFKLGLRNLTTFSEFFGKHPVIGTLLATGAVYGVYRCSQEVREGFKLWQKAKRNRIENAVVPVQVVNNSY